jgi:hypothetical protein
MNNIVNRVLACGVSISIEKSKRQVAARVDG